MPGVLSDLPATWYGIALTSTLFLGVALQFPTTAPGPAQAVADTIDRVAAAPYDSTATHPLPTDALRLGPHRIALRTDAGVTHAVLSYGPITPVAPGTPLARVLHGAPVATVFDTRTAFQAAVEAAQARDPTWRTGVDELLIRRVSWGSFNATLATA